MFKGLNWRAAFKRATLLVAMYGVVLYVMDTAFPRTAGITRDDLPSIAVNAVIFFFVFAFVIAYTEKRRERKQNEASKKNERRPEDSEETAGSLKGKHNPNTSRKKSGRQARRRTRR